MTDTDVNNTEGEHDMNEDDWEARMHAGTVFGVALREALARQSAAKAAARTGIIPTAEPATSETEESSEPPTPAEEFASFLQAATRPRTPAAEHLFGVTLDGPDAAA